MLAIVGLGNPGEEYARTRHNIGFMVVDALAREVAAGPFRQQHSGLVARASWQGSNLLLVKPQTFMNRSGNCIGMLGGYYKLTAADFLIICDDLDLPLGTLRLRQRGGSGGHNGLKSVQAALGTPEYSRMRLGIGRRPEADASGEVIEHVLGSFAKSEEAVITQGITLAAQAALTVLSQGMVPAMNRYNSQSKSTPDDFPV